MGSETNSRRIISRLRLACTVALGIVCVVAYSPKAVAKELSLKELKKIQSNLKQHEFMTVDFEQDIYYALRGHHSISSGIAHFRKPQSFRWISIKPRRTELIFDGKNLLDYNPTKKTAKRYGVGNKQGLELRRIVDMVMNLGTLLSRYQVLKIDQTGSVVVIRIKPKQESDIREATVTVDLEKNYISTVKLQFAGKNHTVFSFANPRASNLGHGIFRAPKGVRVTEAF